MIKRLVRRTPHQMEALNRRLNHIITRTKKHPLTDAGVYVMDIFAWNTAAIALWTAAVTAYLATGRFGDGSWVMAAVACGVSGMILGIATSWIAGRADMTMSVRYRPDEGKQGPEMPRFQPGTWLGHSKN